MKAQVIDYIISAHSLGICWVKFGVLQIPMKVAFFTSEIK